MTLANRRRSVTLRPTHAVAGHVGSVAIIAPEVQGTLTLDFDRGHRRTNLTPRRWRDHYARAVENGYRDVLLALRRDGVTLELSTGARASVGANRVATWVGAVGLICCELVLFATPAGIAGRLISGERSMGSSAATALAVALLVMFILLAVPTSRLPMVIRRSAGEVDESAEDPVAYLEARAWMNEPTALSALLTFLASRATPTGSSGSHPVPTFVPGVPFRRTGLLLGAIVLTGISFAIQDRPGVGGDRTDGSERGRLPPDWLTPDLILIFGLAVTVGLAVVWAVSYFRARRQQGTARHLLLVLAVLGLVMVANLSQEPGASSEELGREWTGTSAAAYVGWFAAMVAIANRRWVVVGLVLVSILAVALTASGAFDSIAEVIVMAPIIGLAAAITWRYLPGGAYLVPMAADSNARLARIVLGMSIAKWLLGALLVVGLGRTELVGSL